RRSLARSPTSKRLRSTDVRNASLSRNRGGPCKRSSRCTALPFTALRYAFRKSGRSLAEPRAEDICMAEVLLQFDATVTSDNGRTYMARACGDDMPGGGWQAWIEFLPIGDGEPVRSMRETTQPNREDTVYWATGLTPVFLEGSLRRALKPLTRPPA